MLLDTAVAVVHRVTSWAMLNVKYSHTPPPPFSKRYIRLKLTKVVNISFFLLYVVGWWRNEKGVRLAIYRSTVQLSVGHCCAATLGKLFTPFCLCHKQYNLVPTKRAVML